MLLLRSRACVRACVCGSESFTGLLALSNWLAPVSRPEAGGCSNTDM